jgi:hypothetical protein
MIGTFGRVRAYAARFLEFIAKKLRRQHMIQVLQIPFDKEKLRTLSKDERAALFLFGYVTNQLMMMEKLITFATNKETGDEPEQQATGVQTQMLLRLMIGLVNEAFRAVETRFSSSPIAKEYIGLLDAGGKNALKDLNKQFGTSILRQLRTNFAFHHPQTDDIDSAFAKAVDDPAMDSEWNWYLSQHGYNTLFYLSDVVINTCDIRRNKGDRLEGRARENYERSHRRVKRPERIHLIICQSSLAQTFWDGVTCQ